MVFKTNYRLMQVKSIAGAHSAILSTFIELPFVIKIFTLSFFWVAVLQRLTVITLKYPSYQIANNGNNPLKMATRAEIDHLLNQLAQIKIISQQCF